MPAVLCLSYILLVKIEIKKMTWPFAGKARSSRLFKVDACGTRSIAYVYIWTRAKNYFLVTTTLTINSHLYMQRNVHLS